MWPRSPDRLRLARISASLIEADRIFADHLSFERPPVTFAPPDSAWTHGIYGFELHPVK
jgi:hypothetical protein